MLKLSIFKRINLLGTLGLMFLSSNALATSSGTVIQNKATLSFSVGGVAQANIISSPLGDTPTGLPTTFTVDRKVDIAGGTAGVTAATNVTPGQSNVVLTYKVQNAGNAPQDFDLAFVALTTDNFDAGACTIHVESGLNVGYQAAEDTALFIDGLAANTTHDVHLVCSLVPNTVTDTQTSAYYLKVIAHTSVAAGLDPKEVETAAGSESDDVEDVRFSDGDGDGAGTDDAPNDGQFVILGNYNVTTANISVSKTINIKSDPVNGISANAQAVPGAVITYTVSITNVTGASTSAILAAVADPLDVALKINATGASWTVTGSTRATTTGTLVADTADADADGLGHADTTLVGGILTATYATILVADAVNGYAAGELKAGESVALVFDVTLQ